MSIEIKKERNAVKIEVWRFSMIRDTLFLETYYIAEKQSTRHRKYINKVYYDRIMSRNNTIEEADVPLSREIKEEALNLYFNKVKCKKWGDRL